MICAEALNCTYGGNYEPGKGPKTPASFLVKKGGKVAANLGYLPGGPEFFQFEGQRRLNIYQPSDVKSREGDVSPWLDHFAYLVPDKAQASHILDYLAYTVQFPADKINHGVLMAGGHRNGKDMFLQPIPAILGEQNVKQVSPGELHTDFNGYVACAKLLIFQEMHTNLGEQRKVEARLKTLLATTAGSLRVNEKKEKPYSVRNFLSVIITSNHRDGINISQGNTARYFAVWIDTKPKKDQYYEDLAKWIGKHVPEIAYFLESRDLSNFRPKAPAPETQFVKEIEDDSQSDIAGMITDRIADQKAPFNHDLATARDTCEELGLDVSKYHRRIGRELAELGIRGRKTESTKGGARRKRTIYVLNHEDQYTELSGAELLEEYERQSPNNRSPH